MDFILPSLNRLFRKSESSLPRDLFDAESASEIPVRSGTKNKTRYLSGLFPSAESADVQAVSFSRSPELSEQKNEIRREIVPPQLEAQHAVTAAVRSGGTASEEMPAEHRREEEVFTEPSFRMFSGEEREREERSFDTSEPFFNAADGMSSSGERTSPPGAPAAAGTFSSPQLNTIAECSRKILRYLKKNNDLLKNGKNNAGVYL